MTYRRKASQTYQQQRRRSRVKAGHLKATVSSTSRSGFSTRSAKVQTFYANIMDLTRFLAKYLSGKQNVIVSTNKSKNAGYSVFRDNIGGKRYYHIKVPDWQTYNLPIRGFDKYRIYRSGLWHESCHARYTPNQVYSHGKSDPLAHDIMNIIEDRRIEDLGVEEWRGYLPERIYANAYGYALRPDVGDMWKKYMQGYDSSNVGPFFKEAQAKIRYEAFMQKLLTGKIKGEAKLPPAEQKRIKDAVEFVEKELEKTKKYKDKQGLVYSDLARLTRHVIDDLDLEGFTPQRISGRGGTPSGSSWDDTFTEDYARQQKANKQKVKKGMEEFFEKTEKEVEKPEKKEKAEKRKVDSGREKGENEEKKQKQRDPNKVTAEDLERAKKGSEQVAKEYQQAQKAGEVDQLTPMFAPVASAVSPSDYRDQKFITDMNAALKEWKTRRKEVVGKTGARLSIPHYIKHKEEPFVTRIKKSARGRKILVIADFSGSMEPREEEYKKAIVSSMEVLDGIGSKTALYGFGGEKGSTGYFFFKVKRFEEPKWKPNHSAKTAALEADYPSTPTAEVYRGLLPYVRKHRPDVTITITDGAPDNQAGTAQIVKQLKKHTRMVAFGIGEDGGTAKYMEKRLKTFGYHKVFAVDSVSKIPHKLVSLIAPTR